MKTKIEFRNWGWLLAGLLLGCSFVYARTIPEAILDVTPDTETGLTEILPLDTVDFIENAMGLNLHMGYVRGGSFEMGA
ncbi:MAG: hypothetical protein K2G46_04200, partial [Bacteroidales bacterium]|nr:hypothetical protein [Bacteroidales bacterium]